MLLLPAALVQAAVVASVDRGRIDLNESFTLRVTVDTAIDVEPDASALDEDFIVGSRSQLSNTTIVNGQITRSRTWTYVLMARRAGELSIPPVVIGSEQSQPVAITVAPPSDATPGEADIFVITEADFDESYVQAQILYTVKVYRAVATRQPRLSEPEITGVDALIEVAGEERTYESILNGKSYTVVERVYAVFPQESGEVRITPARFEARVLRNGRISGRKVFESEPIVVAVKPIPPPPQGYPDAAWLPAKSVELSEEWSREPDELPAGEPITRRLTVTALGQLSTQIPVIDPRVSDGVKVYPDKPELRVAAEAGGILATRTDQYAMIGVRPGAVSVPTVELPWWDIAAGEWKTATLAGRSIDVMPSTDALVPQVVPDVQPAVDSEVGTTVVVHSALWRRIAEVLGGLWLLTLVLWWWSGRPKAPRRAVPEAPPIHKQQSRLLREARKAAGEDRASAVKSALLEWGRLEWPKTAPRSIGDLADRVTDPAAMELRRLCRQSYGPDADEGWNGDALARALRTLAVKERVSVPRIVDALPPLMPERGS
ncbi:MAG: BatD family protein [Pseudomonadota bacterium]